MWRMIMIYFRDPQLIIFDDIYLVSFIKQWSLSNVEIIDFCCYINSLFPGWFTCGLKCVIFKCIVMTAFTSISSTMALRWMVLNRSDNKSSLFQIMAWSLTATSHYLNQCWPRSVPYSSAVLLSFALLYFWGFFLVMCCCFFFTILIHLSIFFRVVSVVQGQSYDCLGKWLPQCQ